MHMRQSLPYGTVSVVACSRFPGVSAENKVVAQVAAGTTVESTLFATAVFIVSFVDLRRVREHGAPPHTGFRAVKERNYS